MSLFFPLDQAGKFFFISLFFSFFFKYVWILFSCQVRRVQVKFLSPYIWYYQRCVQKTTSFSTTYEISSKVCTERNPHTPPIHFVSTLCQGTQISHCILSIKSLINKYIYLYFIYQKTFSPRETFLFSSQRFSSMNFNFLFHFFAASKIHGMDDSRYQIRCLK